LWDDLEKQMRKGLKPDFVIFTGDVSYHGLESEYELAWSKFFEPLLAKTRVGKESLFIVPGNHDCNWKEITDPHRDIARGLLEGTESSIRDKTNNFLENTDNRGYFLKKQQAYQNFLKTYLGDSSYHTAHCYTRFLSLNRCSIGILCLNSAWMSGCFKDSRGEIDDQGKLLLGEMQVVEAIKATQDADLLIGLMHHPLDWLHTVDKDIVSTRLSAKCKIISHGHLHRAGAYNTHSLAGEVVTIPVGAIYETRDGRNGYQFVQLDLASGKGEIFLRRFNNDGSSGPEWTKDINTTGEDRDGKIPFQILPLECAQHISVPLIKSHPDEVDQKRPLPVVVVAMTKDEANELSNNPECTRVFDPSSLALIMQRYQTEREGWYPFGKEHGTIWEILDDFSKKNSLFEKSEGKKISFQVRFEPYSKQFFSTTYEDEEILTDALKSGCLFIVDGLSLFYEDIRARFVGVSGNQNSVIFVTTPINPREHTFNKTLGDLIKKQMFTFLPEHDTNLDSRKGIFIGNQIDLKRHLKVCLQELEMRKLWIPAWRERFEQNNIQSSGISNLVAS